AGLGEHVDRASALPALVQLACAQRDSGLEGVEPSTDRCDARQQLGTLRTVGHPDVDLNETQHPLGGSHPIHDAKLANTCSVDNP
ncbi:MAG: hypothetical protein GTN89_15355, partial [Acidobacteria bacterium]|nr:hypothetical protein [Acidobacteriota bacterium]